MLRLVRYEKKGFRRAAVSTTSREFYPLPVKAALPNACGASNAFKSGICLYGLPFQDKRRRPILVCGVMYKKRAPALKSVWELPAPTLLAVIFVPNHTGEPQGGMVGREIHLTAPDDFLWHDGGQPLNKQPVIQFSFIGF